MKCRSLFILVEARHGVFFRDLLAWTTPLNIELCQGHRNFSKSHRPCRPTLLRHYLFHIRHVLVGRADSCVSRVQLRLEDGALWCAVRLIWEHRDPWFNLPVAPIKGALFTSGGTGKQVLRSVWIWMRKEYSASDVNVAISVPLSHR